jgi:hypothetical protein
MAKESPKTLNENETDAAFLRWEFIRRNKNYAKELEQLNTFIQERTKRSSKGLNSDIAVYDECNAASESFAKKWTFVYYGDEFPSPKKSFSRLSNDQKLSLLSSAVMPGPGNYKTISKVLDFHKAKGLKLPVKEETLTDLRLSIKLDRPQRMIMRDVAEVVRTAKSTRKMAGLKDASKTRYDECKMFIDIYDCRNKGMTNKQIANKLYGEDNPTESLENKISKSYQRAKKLIQSGYRRIW